MKTKLRGNAATRVAIAKDVLLLLRRKKTFVPTKSSYLNIWDNEICEFVINNGDSGAQENLSVLIPGCQVCALGAMFIGMVHLKNEVTVRQFYRSGCDNIKVSLEDYFEPEQIDLIERCFEGWPTPFEDRSQGRPLCRLTQRRLSVPMSYYDSTGTAAQRMKIIMKNIIRNDGTFVPSQDIKQGSIP